MDIKTPARVDSAIHFPVLDRPPRNPTPGRVWLLRNTSQASISTADGIIPISLDNSLGKPYKLYQGILWYVREFYQAIWKRNLIIDAELKVDGQIFID